jgi:phage shock protein PspC (stress-responsive transcriptional regulator)
MQRIIQINIAGRVLPIEEDAYTILKDYLKSLERQFSAEEGKEILEDIEYRIAELFSIRLQSGSPAIDRTDVQKVIETLGAASDLHDGPGTNSQGRTQSSFNTGGGYSQGGPNQQQFRPTHDRLLRNPYDKMIGGVCSGIAQYFDIDPVITRLVMVALFLTFGIGFIAYIIAWAVIPAARTPAEFYNMNSGNPMTFHDISSNMQGELKDLKKRGEEMSRELKDFFSKKR